MKKLKKKEYLAPSVEVIEIALEEGFAASDGAANSNVNGFVEGPTI